MTRRYGMIHGRFWTDRDIAALSDDAKMLFVLLLTAPVSNGVGCYLLGDGAVADLLRWTRERIVEGFVELSRNGFAYRFEGVVYIPNFLRWNPIANSNIAKARFVDWEQLPKGQPKAHAARALLTFCDLWGADHRRALEAVAQMVSEPFPNPSETVCQPEREREKEKGIEREREKPRARKNAPADSLTEPGFQSFWNTYPRKQGKGAAAKSYSKTTEAERRVIATVLPLFVSSWPWTHEPQFIPNPATWLNQRRWEDDAPPQDPPPEKKSAQFLAMERLAHDIHDNARTVVGTATRVAAPAIAAPRVRPGTGVAGDDGTDVD